MPDEGNGGVVRGCGWWELGLAEQRLLVTFAGEAPELSEFLERERMGARHRAVSIDAGGGGKDAGRVPGRPTRGDGTVTNGRFVRS